MADTTTSSAPSEGTLRRIRNLLAQAEHPKTDPNEAEAMFGQAAAMMFKYQVDQATLGVRKDAGAAPRDVTIVSRTIRIQAPYAKEKDTLMHAVSTNFGVAAVVFIPRTWKGYKTYTQGIRVEVFGTEEDLDQVEMMFTSLTLQAARQLMKARPARPTEDVATYRASWMLGYASRINWRLQQLKKDALAESSGSGAELVLVDRAALAQRALNDKHGELADSKPIKTSGSGMGHGAVAAQTADLGQRRFNDKTAGELAG